ncbi:CpaF family protein [Sneathiella marina]|uniref:CpaF family protein n=1 Tax=Sneathiella marina TaxID=2950108 RepID=A0ABY4W808_9PROT|nr:CpaF family protein [Sneathiella marina]USG63039.1 CpaF family protein [Sneathiella marina]
MFGKRADYSGQRGLKEEPVEWTGKSTVQQIKNKKALDGPLLDTFDRVRRRFFDRVDPNVAMTLAPDLLSQRIRDAVVKIVDEENLSLNGTEQALIARELFDDIAGIGPIEGLLSDPHISDILVNGPNAIYVERNGKLERTDLKFRDDAHVLETARRIAASVGRRIDESNPMVDARLVDGSRVNVIAPPLSVYGTIISIRKFSKEIMNLDEMCARRSFSPQIHALLKLSVRCRLNILIAGGTGTGKTTLLNALSGLIDEHERIVTIEDSAEMCLQRSHVVSLETRQKNTEGQGEVSQRDLLRNSLRMRPDRIIVGEVRGAEVHDMLQAMNTGHDGSMSTIHANTSRDALLRLENLILSSQANYHSKGSRRQIASAIDMVIHVDRQQDGRRFIRNITEIVGLEGDVITSQDIFTYDKTRDLSDDFSQNSRYICSGIRPVFHGKIDKYKQYNNLSEVFSS